MANLDLSKYGIKDVKEISTTRLMMYCSLKRPNRVWKASKKVK